uniref:FAD-binding domain-containing protein n=1 Tax=Kalanchoe fedtschenkoi TaxID=63787 RepID=A0A7N0U402_KALFE
MQGVRDVWQNGAQERRSPISNGEARCLIRSVLIETLADELPFGTVRFGCQIVSVMSDPVTAFPVLQIVDGRTIKAKILIGCDGANSVVAKFLKLRPVKAFSLSAIRGFTNYPTGHNFPSEFLRIRGKDGALCGRIPVNDKLVYWFVVLQDFSSSDVNTSTGDGAGIREQALESAKGLPAETVQMVANCDQESLSLTRLRYRAPWDIRMGNFREGTVTVAGDAMHVMGPFLGQGGSAALEDAVVLARCLSRKMNEVPFSGGRTAMAAEVGEALDEFVEERRMRVVWLSTQSFLSGSMLARDTSFMLKPLCLLLLRLLFRDSAGHTRYDCGEL